MPKSRQLLGEPAQKCSSSSPPTAHLSCKPPPLQIILDPVELLPQLTSAHPPSDPIPNIPDKALSATHKPDLNMSEYLRQGVPHSSPWRPQTTYTLTVTIRHHFDETRRFLLHLDPKWRELMRQCVRVRKVYHQLPNISNACVPTTPNSRQIRFLMRSRN